MLDHIGIGPDGGTPSPRSIAKEKATLSPSRIEAMSGTTYIDMMGARRACCDNATLVAAVGLALQLASATATRGVHSTTSRRDDAERDVILYRPSRGDAWWNRVRI